MGYWTYWYRILAGFSRIYALLNLIYMVTDWPLDVGIMYVKSIAFSINSVVAYSRPAALGAMSGFLCSYITLVFSFVRFFTCYRAVGKYSFGIITPTPQWSYCPLNRYAQNRFHFVVCHHFLGGLSALYWLMGSNRITVPYHCHFKFTWVVNCDSISDLCESGSIEISIWSKTKTFDIITWCLIWRKG